MNNAIHPEYHTITVTCSCGNSFETKSTAKYSSIEVCANCHPFYTGKQKLVDTAGRVQQFNKRYAQRTTSKDAANSESK